MFESKFPAVIDSTIMKEWTRCKQATFQKYFLGKRMVEGNYHDLNVGKSIASAMEETRKCFYVYGQSELDSIENGLRVLVDQYGEDFPDSCKSISKCKEVFYLYFKKYPLDKDFGLVPISSGVECKFSFGIGIEHPDTGKELMYSGRFDMIAEEKGEDPFFSMSEENKLWVVDEKTTKMLFGSNWMYDYDLDWQMIGYKWASSKMGYDVHGVKVRKLVMGKKKINPLTDLPEISIHFNEKTISDWESNMINIANEMVDIYKKNEFAKSYGNACNEYKGCDYRSICLNLPQPEWAEVRWNPLD